LILGSQRPLFVLCAREIQKSIAESVHRTLATQADALGLGKFYEVMSNKIIGKPMPHWSGTLRSTEFVFAGIRNNITAIKSMEGIDICAVFEATQTTSHSWETLIPTVRGDPPMGPFGQGSEIWVEFNPELDSDNTYRRWVLEPPAPAYRFEVGNEGVNQAIKQLMDTKPKPTTVIAEVNWRDNEWFPQTSRAQMEELRKRDYESYLTVWEGKVRRIVKGAIYAKELEKAQKEGRISPTVHVDRSKPVDIGVDLGRADMTTLWFMQQVGMEHHAVDYYGNFGFDWSHYLEQIQERKYIIGRIYLPHDAVNKHVDAKKSVYQQTRDAYPNPRQVIKVPRTPKVMNDINAVRLLFPRMWFNELLCADGLHALSHYRYEVDPDDARNVSNEPCHDFASHAADGLRSYVMGLKTDFIRGAQRHVPPDLPYSDHAQGWMAR
jgi:phage terminase large subunit